VCCLLAYMHVHCVSPSLDLLHEVLVVVGCHQ
jgi:hypothetical protein